MNIKNSNTRTNMLPRVSIIHSSINMKNGFTCLPGKKSYIFKGGNYQNFILSRIFVVSFLSLIIFFLQNKYKPINNVSSKFQFKCNISRRLAEPEGDMNDRNSGETISCLELLSQWESNQKDERRRFDETLQFLLEQLHKEAPSYNIGEEEKNRMWSSFLGDAHKCAAETGYILRMKLDDLVRSGSCTREESRDFLDFLTFQWSQLRYITEKEFWKRLNRSRRSKFGLFPGC